MALTHNSTTEDNEPAWGSVDKTKLPRQAFADHGEPDQKSTWGYPHHHVRNGGDLDENGVYTSGDMYLNRGGLNAAWAAANGARTGQKASQEVLDHLQAHRRALGLDEEAGAQLVATTAAGYPPFLLPHVAARLFDTPLAIEPRKLRTIIAVLSPRFGITLQGIAAQEPTDMQPKKRKPYGIINGTAVIPVMGTLVQRSSGLDALSGLTSYTQLSAEFDQALHDPEVRQILLHIDSPGGEAAGLFDFTDQIFQSRGVKSSVALIDGMGTSAAYAIAAAAGRTYITQGSISGSIGVRLVHVDESQANAQDGYTVTEIYAGSHKVDGSPNMPLTESGLASLQELVNESYDLFTNKVALYRGTSQAAMKATEAALYVGAKAIPISLIDGITTLQQILGAEPATEGDSMDKITTSAALATAYPDLYKEITAAAVKAEQERMKEILGLAGYTLPKLVEEALFVNGGLSVDKAARLFLEKKYEKTQAQASAFLADAIEPAQVNPLPTETGADINPVQAQINRQLGLDTQTYLKYANGRPQA